MPDASFGECHSGGLHACWATDIGSVRLDNEDAVRALPEEGLLIVSDGMGGEYAGHYASEIVIGRLPVLLREEVAEREPQSLAEAGSCLRRALRHLNRFVRQESGQLSAVRRMGATVVTALVKGQQFCVAHMGDSRAYLWQDGNLEQLTRDHSVVSNLVEDGLISREEARSHPLRGQILRFVGMDGDASADLLIARWDPRDRLLLCTDGLSGPLSPERMRAILAGRRPMADMCRDLIEAAKGAGSTDNITVLLCEQAQDVTGEGDSGR